MSQKFIAISLVAALIGGAFIYLFGGIGVPVRGGNSKDVHDSPVAFDLSPKASSAAENAKAPATLDIKSIPDVIAEVDGVPIKSDVFVKALQSLQQNIQKSGGAITQAQLDGLRNNILENIINAEVLLTKAKKDGVKPDKAKVDQNFKMFRGRFPDEAAFDKALKERSLTRDALRANIEKNFTIQVLIEKDVVSKITIDDKDVKKYYEMNQAQFDRKESVHAAHILAMFEKTGGETKKDAAKKKIDAIRKKLDGGADFGKLAKSESDDKGSALKNGDLGFFERGRMVPEFEKAAFDSKPGTVTGIVETQFGYHIIKVIEKRPGGRISLKEAKKNIKAQLKRQKADKSIKEYLGKLKKKMNVKKFI